MSSLVFSKQNSTPVQTRRAQLRNEDNENNRRSLSGKFRNLFRKNSSSPTRSPPLSTRQRSSSPESVRTGETPHLRAPLIKWPFGKKKNKSNDNNRKIKKKTPLSIEISSPIHYQEHQTSIRGQNFVPRTPELAHGGSGRTHSTSSFETTTKGFRGYTIIDNKKSSQQVMVSDLDVVSPPPYVSDHSPSPSLNRRRLPDTSIEHSYHNEISLPRSEIEMIPTRKQNSAANSSTLTATQVLIEQNPLFRSTTSSKPTNGSTLSNQWKTTSYSSSNNSEIRSTLSSSKEVEIPKLNVPLISLGSTSNKKESKYVNDTYNSLITGNNINPSTNQSYTRTYGSLPDADALNNNNLYKSIETIESYPGLEAIIKHHFLPISVHYQPRLPETTSPKRTIRFDTSTTTLYDYDDRPQWSTTIHNDSPSPSPSPSPSTPSIHRHDGYIRPLTPQKPLIQPDISTIHVNLDDLRRRSPIHRSFYHSPETTPKTYRSSTTIYTKDKHNYTDGGELRTWSIQKNDNNHDRKGEISFQLIPTKTSNEVEEEYVINHYSNNLPSTNFLRSSFFNERDKIYDQSTRSYKQESFNTITTPVEKSEVELRHYTLKRTDSYDGFGVIISADSDTRLNHRIRDIEYGSPGSRIGLRKNDRIIKVNGINVENMIFDDVLQLIKQGLNNNNLQFSVL